MTSRGSARHFFQNWRGTDLSLTTKLRLAIRNNAIKARTGKSCCGNYGEPGC